MSGNRSKELYKEACGLIPGGVNSPVRAFGQVGGVPIYIKSAKGSAFTDVEGRQFTDFCMSWGPLILGHAHPEVVEAVREAAGAGLSYGACHEREVELARRVLSAFPGMDRVRVVNSGTEAVMTALRIARGATGRSLTVKLEGGYHGHFDGMLVKAGSGLATHAIASSAGIPEPVAATTLVAPLDDEEALEKLFTAHGDQIAALIIEPLPANNGLLPQRAAYLQGLRRLTREHGALLIFDEVISGFRLRFGGYGDSIGVRPDLVTLGKVIGGGMPIGAVVGPAALMDLLSPVGSVYQAGTLSGNPVSLAAGNATLRVLQEDPPYARLEALGRLFEEVLAEKAPGKAQVQRAGSVLWPYLENGPLPRRADAISNAAMERFKKIYWPLVERGYYLPPSSYEVLFVSAAHTEDDVRGLAVAIAEELS
jgi:glutamate-1-semialdehyde 2,1-aminomutase